MGFLHAQSSVESYSMNFIPKPDSTSDVIIQLALNDSVYTDSLFIVLVNSDSEEVYTGANDLAGWQTAGTYTIERNILHLTINIGAHTIYKKYTSYAVFRKPEDEEVTFISSN